MKRNLAPAMVMRLAAAAIALIGLSTAAALAQEKTDVTFVHVNDVYRIAPAKGRGGLAKFATIVKQEKQKGGNVIVTHGGDSFSPSLLSGFDKGAHMVDMLNKVGMDAMVLGNHEFDFGPDITRQRIAEAKFPMLGANIRNDAGEAFPGTVPSVIKTAGPFKIGMFGLAHPETGTLSSPGAQWRFTDPIATARDMAASLRKQGADLIVALSHLGIDGDRALIAARTGVDIVLGGHDHDAIVFYDGRNAIIQAGEDGNYVGILRVSMWQKEKRGKMRFYWQPDFALRNTATVEADPDIAAQVAVYEEKLSEALDVEIGETAVELDSRRATVRTQETGFANLIADAMRESVGADVALTNGGGIRGDRTYPPGSKLTRRDIQTELPFGNVTVKLAISGANLLAALENGLSQVEKKAGRFPHVAGMKVVYDPAAPAGSRVISVTIGGKPLDKNKTYTLATNDYIANGGDGYKVLKSAKVLIDKSAGTLLATTVMDYIAAKGKISPRAEGRLQQK